MNDLAKCIKCGAKPEVLHHPHLKLYFIYCSDNCEQVWTDAKTATKKWNERQKENEK